MTILYLEALAAMAVSLSILMVFAWVVLVSVAMFEQMMSWRQLLTRLRSWLKPDFFMHIFTHAPALICSTARTGSRSISSPAGGDAEPPDGIEAVLRTVYGSDTGLCVRRWPWFFLATGACPATTTATSAG